MTDHDKLLADHQQVIRDAAEDQAKAYAMALKMLPQKPVEEMTILELVQRMEQLAAGKKGGPCMSEITWQPKEEWSFTDNKSFRVTVKHWVNDWADSTGRRGPDNWNVYIHVYPAHPHFPLFNADMDSGDSACQAYDFHGGATYFTAHRKKDSVSSYEIGCDYAHLYDERFSRMATKDQAREVFLDAENLVRYMESTKADAVEAKP